MRVWGRLDGMLIECWKSWTEDKLRDQRQEGENETQLNI